MPYAGEHTAQFKIVDAKPVRVNRTKGSGERKIQGVKIPKNISVMWSVDAENKITPQSLRFSDKLWTESVAKEWLLSKGIKYDNMEKAIPSEKNEKTIPCYVSYVNETKNTLDIILHDEIGFFGTQSGEFLQLLKDNANVKVINIDINSPGGRVADGISIYNSLKEHSATVNVKISGVAASMASVVAMAGDNIEMPETAMMMIHKPLIPFMTDADARKLRTQADALDKMETSIIKAYQTHMTDSADAIGKMLAATTWFTAEEAKDAGLTDKVTDEVVDALNYFDYNTYNYGEVPAAVLDRYDINRDDSLEGLEDPVEKTMVIKFIDAVKKQLNSNKEPNTMADNKVEEKTANENKELKEKNEALTTENAALKQSNTDRVEAEGKASAEQRKKEFTEHLNGLVEEGKIKPIEVGGQAAIMEVLYLADADNFTDEKKETPTLDAHKNSLKNLSVTVPVGERQFANSQEAGGKDLSGAGKDPLAVAAQKIMDEAQKNKRTISYSDALKEAHADNPSLYDESNQAAAQ